MPKTIIQVPAPALVGAELNFLHLWDPNTSGLQYIPWRGTNDGTNVSSDFVSVFFSGQIQFLEIVAWSVGVALGSTTFALHRNKNSTPSASVTVDMAVNDTPYLFDFRGEANTTVSDLEEVALSCDPSSDPQNDIYAWSRWARV